MLNRAATLVLGALVAQSALAATRNLTVTSPKQGDFLGSTNTINFKIDNAVFQVKVKVTATNFADKTQKISNEGNFTPDAQGVVVTSLSLNFSEGSPQGRWDIVVEAEERDTNGTLITDYNPSTRKVSVASLTIDTKSPTFFNLNPLDGTFVKGDSKGDVIIAADLNEANVDKWKVQTGGKDIPNNEGSNSTVFVKWNINGIPKNGQQTVTIKVDDKAKNSTTKTATLTIDRTAPTTQIVTPGPGSVLPPNTDVLVSVKSTDNFSESIAVTGFDVRVEDVNGNFILRPARKSFNSSGNSVTWSGRIRWRSSLPNEFYLVVSTLDKAGNLAVKQRTKVKIGGR